MTTLHLTTGKELIAAIKQEDTGIIQHNLSLVIGTHVVKSLFIGENKGRIGLLKFSKMVKAMTIAAHQDDPYAEQFLKKLDNMISKVRKSIKTMLAKAQADQPHPKGILIGTPTTTKPLTICLQFNTEYAYLATFMLAECDELIHFLVRQVEVGFSPRHELGGQLAMIKRQIRRVFSLPLQWHNTGIIRSDLISNNERALRAKMLMGTLNHTV